MSEVREVREGECRFLLEHGYRADHPGPTYPRGTRLFQKRLDASVPICLSEERAPLVNVLVYPPVEDGVGVCCEVEVCGSHRGGRWSRLVIYGSLTPTVLQQELIRIEMELVGAWRSLREQP